nr:interferon-induced gtp-binding protein mx [Quercus suber]
MLTQYTGHQGLGDPSMLERIDALFSCGAGEYVNIPQIVVVGDQSSGKSSVLSGLIRKDLPRDSGLCTRFATKIVFRRAEQTGIRVSIVPDEQATAEHRARLAAKGVFNIDTFEDVAFGDIIKEVRDAIGIKSPDETANDKPTFSGDVLQLEISGPKEEHLSVIDVPGIFRDPTPGLTTKDDIKLVRDMVLRYMENPRSVMLAVVPANVDVATQEILQLASDLDPDGDRTLGVLTKPDLVDAGAEDRIIDLVQGRARPMKLGWHILRNPGQKDLENASFDRQRQEHDFFRSVRPWNTLDHDDVGIEALRRRLKDVLSSLIRREFVKVKVEVQKKLTTAEEKLKGLGPERNSRASQAAYLTEISARFQHLVDLALSANFGTDDLFDRYRDLRIAPAVVLRMEQFKADITLWGHKYSFELPEEHGEPHSAPSLGGKNKRRSHTQVEMTTDLKVRRHIKFPDVEDLLHPQEQLSRIRSEDNPEWLRGLHHTSRGFELGTFDPVILASALRQQTVSWRPISFGYVSDIASMIHTFILTALESICTNDRLKDDLYSFLSEDLRVRYIKAMEQVDFILDVEIGGIPMTQNSYFVERLGKRRYKRFSDSLASLSFNDNDHGPIIKVNEILPNAAAQNEDELVEDIHAILQTYYEVCLMRFIDNVCKQATDHFLVNGLETPLRVFTPVFVSRMTDEQLEKIAKEEPQVEKQRAKLTKDIKSLKTAKKILA